MSSTVAEPSADRSAPSAYRLFEVVGLELEYPIVDVDLRPLCLVEDAFRLIRRRPTSEVEYRQVGFSNELAAHVFELKTLAPQYSLVRAEAALFEGASYFAEVLREHFGARLLPTGMHPFMRPGDTRLWRRAGRRIYEAYERIFPLREHGWLNVQSCHVNLPFGTEVETVMLHNAIACLLPYLPALAASSPIYEGRLGDCVDNRLAFYRGNQRRIPQITGDVVPEYMISYQDYRREILWPIYTSLEELDGGDRLMHEWVNSRGAIPRFARKAIEIRVLDVQECVKADVAIAAFVRAAARALVDRLRSGRLALPDHGVLVSDFDAVVWRGGGATVQAPHLGSAAPEKRAREVLRYLYALANDEMIGEERAYLPLIESRIENGSLSERIRRRLKGSARWPQSRRIRAIREIYEELAVCLLTNTPWEG